MKKVAKLISKYFGLIIIIFMVLGFVTPGSFKWVTSKIFGQSFITVLLGIIMFGMGMTLSVNDFKIVLKKLGSSSILSGKPICHNAFGSSPSSII